jgi:S-DNA-T family DNA segregation ATPase FtsK/SpoIIIE
LSTPLGRTGAGPFVVDLVGDGPHALVAGTTGSGKSELLRALVAGLAARSHPDDVTFLLVDFKGGSAFDVCARLPHTVGVVTDLDEHLAARALRCLEAELRRREQVLRRAGAVDIAAYGGARRAGGRVDEPLPRLVVVVDEFAALRAELPTFVDALVDVAQRGRSLGVHLVLATQRPQGAVNDTIRANTNLRIALRVQDQADSLDLVGVAGAASLPRSVPGRAMARLGPGEVVVFQAALATASESLGAGTAVIVEPFPFAPVDTGGVAAPERDARRSDLDVLSEAITEAFRRSGRRRPRRPWTDPLPVELDLTAVLAATPDGDARGLVPMGVADDPDRQVQEPAGWLPGEGNLLVLGAPGAGVTTTMGSLALALSARHSPDVMHVYVVDGGAGALAPLVDLPHVGAVVAAGDQERQRRLVRHLGTVLERRRNLHPADRAGLPTIVTIVDGLGAVLAAHDAPADQTMTDALGRLVADGPGVGLYTVIGADRAGAVPHALAAAVAQRIVLRLVDDGGHDRHRPRAGTNPGRGVLVPGGLELQVAHPVAGLAAAVADLVHRVEPAATTSRPAPIGVLPDDLALVDLGAVVAAGPDAWPWSLPVGISEHDLAPVALTVHRGEHVVVAGPARSGRTSALAALAFVARQGCPALEVHVVAPGRSPLATLVPGAHRLELAGTAGRDPFERPGPPALVLVDDAERADDPLGLLEELLVPDRWCRPLVVAVAARNDAYRRTFAGLLREVRRSRLGFLLQPDADLDGELLGTTLPRRAPVPWVPGRGYLVADGVAALVQLARAAHP